MSTQSTNLNMTILEEGDPADLTTISDNFDAIDAVVGDIATVESSPTASSHAVGEFLLYEGRLYKVTSAISAGGSLILGTNVQAANVGNEIKSLKDSLSQDTITINGWYSVCISAPGSSSITALFAAHSRYKNVSVTKSKAFVNGAWVSATYTWAAQTGDMIEINFNKPSNTPDGIVLMDLSLTISF